VHSVGLLYSILLRVLFNRLSFNLQETSTINSCNSGCNGDTSQHTKELRIPTQSATEEESPPYRARNIFVTKIQNLNVYTYKELRKSLFT
jgi:hypothetical protein